MRLPSQCYSMPVRPLLAFRRREARVPGLPIAKAMMGLAALNLAEEGKLDPDTPIQRYVPTFSEKRWTVTPRQTALCETVLKAFTR